MIFRQRDANSGWTGSAPRREGAADGTLEERRYYCQNWRGDLSAILTSGGVMVEWAKFTSYGIPIGLPGGDTDSDGDCDASDESAIDVWAAGYDVRYDFDLDGDIDDVDEALAASNVADAGWNVLSDPDLNANRVGYAGYQHDYNLGLNHVRNRVYSAELGRWTRRDPLGYIDGPILNLYIYTSGMPSLATDPEGTAWNRGQFAVFVDDASDSWWEWFKDFYENFPLSTPYNLPNPANIIGPAPDAIRAWICTVYKDYYIEHLHTCDKDPRCQYLRVLCDAANGTYPLRHVCCSDVQFVPGHGPVVRPVHYRTICPPYMSDKQCCGKVPFPVGPGRPPRPGFPTGCSTLAPGTIIYEQPWTQY